MRPLHWKRRWREESPENDLVLDDKMRSEPRNLVDTSREDRRTEAETSEGPDSGMACASDDQSPQNDQPKYLRQLMN